MKVEITEKGAHGPDGKELKVGSEVNVKGDEMPGWLVGKAREVAGGKVAVTNPKKNPVKPQASGQERQALMKDAATVLKAEDFTEAGLPDVRALNAMLTKDAEPFTAEERDQLWPGIADDVKAARG